MSIFMSLVRLLRRMYHGLFRAPANALGSPTASARASLIARGQLGVEGAQGARETRTQRFSARAISGMDARRGKPVRNSACLKKI
jgi:hypothetical protein